jgi:hypothetical protein
LSFRPPRPRRGTYPCWSDRPDVCHPGEAATAFTRKPKPFGLHDVEVTHIVTDGPWAIAALAATCKNGTRSHPIVFLRHVEDGWTVIRAAGNGSGWTDVPRDHTGDDRRKGIAGFTMAVPHEVEELRVSPGSTPDAGSGGSTSIIRA